MFHKDFKVKSNSSIKGSERKRLRNEIAAQYPSLSPEKLNILVPSREDMNQMKIFTHIGQVVKIYLLGPNPIFFESEKHFFPTVYTLWKHPELVPTFCTWPPVIENLCNGADLMLPGVVLREGMGAIEKLQTIRSGEICSICLVGNRAPIAVGTSVLSGQEIFNSKRKGKAVIVAHVYGDKLWALGEKSQMVHLDEEQPFSDKSENAVSEEITDEMSRLAIDENAVEAIIVTEDIAAELDQETNFTAEKTLAETMDETLMRSFLTAMKTTMKKAELPLLASTFYSAHILAACPSDGDSALDIKKSSYKKVSNFLDEMHQQGFVHIQELSKGVKSIVGVNLDHETLKHFRPDRVPTQQSSAEPEKYVPPRVKELFCASAAVLPIFKEQGVSKGKALSAGEVRQRLTEYVKANELQSPTNPKDVMLDPLLTNVLLGKDEYTMILNWEELFGRTLAKMSKAYEIQFTGKQPQFRKGALEPIDITVLQRTGNKKVTLVFNLESYGIDPETFAHQVQVGVAASTSVTPAPTSKRGSQVLVQGNQVRFVGKLLLDEYKLPRKYIQGLDKAPPSKKK